jgi:hypothetical protein
LFLALDYKVLSSTAIFFFYTFALAEELLDCWEELFLFKIGFVCFRLPTALYSYGFLPSGGSPPAVPPPLLLVALPIADGAFLFSFFVAAMFICVV